MVCAVHDVVSDNGVPLLDISGAEMRVEDATASADVAPIHPHFGKQHLADQPLEDRLEHTRGGGQSVPVGESERISHVSQLESVTAEILLPVSLPLHQVPLVRQLTGQIREMPEMADLEAVKACRGMGGAGVWFAEIVHRFTLPDCRSRRCPLAFLARRVSVLISNGILDGPCRVKFHVVGLS
jgi:hypothetical protein